MATATAERNDKPLDHQPSDERPPGQLRPVTSGAAPGPTAIAAATPAAKKPSKAPKVFGGLLAVAVVVGGLMWVVGHGKESTDDAQVEGRIVNVSARVAGQVAHVLVKDNQLVNAGDILVELDRNDLEARLDAAKADVLAARASLEAAQAQLHLTQVTASANLRQASGGLTQASSGLEASKNAVEQGRADVINAEATARLAEQDLVRAKELFANNTIPQSELDLRTTRAEQARAQLAVSKARLAGAEAQLGSSSGGVTVASGRLSAAQTAPQQVAVAKAAVDAAAAKVKQAEAAERIASLNASYADVRAAVRGVVSRRTVEVGQLVSPERPLMALVPPDDLWVVANFKEEQAAKMKPGQRAFVKFDAFGSREFEGKVDSVASATGARFSLLPPDNSSGNFIKVVQRVPVLIRLDKLEGGLRPGLSAEATVRVNE
ncbi:MAG: HlyD family secretion protein [Deltaproteobacteria bacterium]|nr:HlyD family secretion protein [Deltaproteobacteria bacterium]